MEKGSRIPQLRRSSRVLPQLSDMNKRKKVKFSDTVCDRDSMRRPERNPSPSIDDGKTSEFKSFRRLLRETGSKCHSSEVPKHVNQLKSVQEVHEKNDSVVCKSEGIRFSLPIQEVTPIAQRSPSAKIPQNFELDSGTKYKHHRSSSMSPIQEVVVSWNSSLSPDFSLNCEPKLEWEGIFQKKRKNLLKLATEASFHKVDEILSNKSDLIQKFLQRLGVGRKLGNICSLPLALEELPTSGQNVSYGDTKESQKILKPALKRNCEMDLLAYGSSEEVNNLIGLPLDHIKPQEFPTCGVRELGFPCQRWPSNLPSDKKGELNLYARNKSDSNDELESEFGWCQTMCSTNYQADEGLSLPLGFPAFDELDDERFYTNSTLAKADDFGKLPQEIRWNSNSSIKEEGISEDRLVSTGYHITNHMLLKDNLPKGLMFRSFPTRRAIEAGSQCKDKDLQTEERSTSEVEFAYSKCGFHSMDQMTSNFNCQIPNSFPIVPYIKPTSFLDLSSSDLYSELEQEQCVLPLLQWSGNNKNSKEVGSLPLTLHEAPYLLDKPEGFRCVFSSSPRSPIHSVGPNREHCWSICRKFQFDEDQVDDGLAYIERRNIYDPCPTERALMDIQTHFANEECYP